MYIVAYQRDGVSRGGYRILKGEGPKENVGQKARMNFATWGAFMRFDGASFARGRGHGPLRPAPVSATGFQ